MMMALVVIRASSSSLLLLLLACGCWSLPTTRPSPPCHAFFRAWNDHLQAQRIAPAVAVDKVDANDAIIPHQLRVKDIDIVADKRDKKDGVDDWITAFVRHGGWCILELTDDNHRPLQHLWNVTDRLFAVWDHQQSHSDDDDDNEKDSHELSMMRNQQLIQGNNGHNSNGNVGYQYVEVSRWDVNTTSNLERIVPSSQRVVIESLDILSRVGRHMAARIVAHLLPPVNYNEAQGMMDCLLGSDVKREYGDDVDDKESSSRSSKNSCHPEGTESANFQRLARYRPPASQTLQTENLAAHCDWSILTLIPVSAIPGLQVFDTATCTWRCPEQVIAAEATKTRSVAPDPQYHASHVVVLTGKYLELLTHGRVPATVHRVVSPRGTPQRYSLPFFLRLRLNVVDVLERSLVLADPLDMQTSMTITSQFLQRLAWKR